MIDIYYYSLTGNIPRFLAKCGVSGQMIGTARPSAPFVLVTNTLGFGGVPAPVAEFLREHGDLLAGVAASGNRNWGANFAKAGDIIATEYGVPLLLKFELAGTTADVAKFKEELHAIYNIKQ